MVLFITVTVRCSKGLGSDVWNLWNLGYVHNDIRSVSLSIQLQRFSFIWIWAVHLHSRGLTANNTASGLNATQWDVVMKSAAMADHISRRSDQRYPNEEESYWPWGTVQCCSLPRKWHHDDPFSVLQPCHKGVQRHRSPSPCHLAFHQS